MLQQTGLLHGRPWSCLQRDSPATMTCSSCCRGSISASANNCCCLASASLNPWTSSSSLPDWGAKGAWVLLGRPRGEPAQLDCLPSSQELPMSSKKCVVSCWNLPAQCLKSLYSAILVLKAMQANGIILFGYADVTVLLSSQGQDHSCPQS